MYQVFGIKLFEFSKDEKNLWYDHDQKKYDPKGFGVFFSIRGGRLLQPMPKFWKWGFWGTDKQYNGWENEFWFVLNVPFFVFPFLSISIGPYGLYAGVKPYSLHRPRYYKWLPNWEELPKDAMALCISTTMRRTRWK